MSGSAGAAGPASDAAGVAPVAAPRNRVEALARLTAPGQPYELQTIDDRGQSLRVFVNAPPTLRALIEQTATDLPFIVYEDERLSFAQAWQSAARIARVLVEDCGVRPGDRVAIAMRNYPEWIHAFVATVSIGAIAVAMNALWQPDELCYGLADSGAKVLLADQERLDRIERGTPPAGLQVLGVRAQRLPAGARSLAELVAARGETTMPAADIAPTDPAAIFYTSGSTGQPKGVVLTHRGIVHAMLSWELDQQAGMLVSGIAPPQLPYQAATLLAIPLFHVTGSHAVWLMCYRLQRRLVSMYKWDPERAAALIERERITSFVAPAAMTGDLVRIARATEHDLSSLLVVGGGGAPRAPEQVRRIDEVFEKRTAPNTGWGMTETNAIGTGIAGPDYLARPASSGRCSAVMELKIVGDDGRELPTGERGELLVRGTGMFAGYWQRPDANAQSFVDGWFRTGDVAYLDADGYLFIVDRIKDLIIRGGENIGCGAVEAALLQHPQVHEAAVYAVPDERLGEEVGATVHGAPGLDADALREFLAQHLAKFEVPRYIVISDEPLPRTASGKILKRRLRDAAVAAMTTAAAPPTRRGHST